VDTSIEREDRLMMLESLKNVFWILVFPGLLFTVFLGLAASWLVRKVSALVQWRVGPPVYQPFADVMKLMGKEIMIPERSNRTVFIAAPLIGFSGVLLLAAVLWGAVVAPAKMPLGDVIVALYLTVFPSLALILGSSASGSPHSSIGTAREMKLVISYELPLVLALIVVLAKSGGNLSLAELASRTPVLSISGCIAFIVALFCVQAKLGFTPFDMAEAETELAGGVLLEYSGGLLAVWKLMQAMMLVTLPLFLVMVFLGGFHPSVWAGIGKYVLVLVLVILIKNTNPRVRTDQAMRFFWIYCGVIMVVAVVLASLGAYFYIEWL